MISLVLFILAGLLYLLEGFGEANVSIWAHASVAFGLALSGFDPRRWFK